MRTARINVAGNVTKEVSYKAEIDLCDEGKIKMLDAYTQMAGLWQMVFRQLQPRKKRMVPQNVRLLNRNI